MSPIVTLRRTNRPTLGHSMRQLVIATAVALGVGTTLAYAQEAGRVKPIPS